MGQPIQVDGPSCDTNTLFPQGVCVERGGPYKLASLGTAHRAAQTPPWIWAFVPYGVALCDLHGHGLARPPGTNSICNEGVGGDRVGPI